MTVHPINLTGCSPSPLARYLKGLGILRYWTQGEEVSLLPIQGLRPGWLSHFERTSVESSLALSLAGMSSKRDKETHWLRQNLEAVKPKGQFRGAPLEWNSTPGNVHPVPALRALRSAAPLKSLSKLGGESG